MVKKTKKIRSSTKFLSASYDKAKYNRKARYIHKYYLPRELQSCVLLADICALMYEHEEWNIWEGIFPDPLPSCVIHYNDLCLEKTIPHHEVKAVLHAMCSYFKDLQDELTEEENQAAVRLNAWLTDWEKGLLAECLRIRKDAEQKVRSNVYWTNDYEIDLEVSFHVRDDDQFSDENTPEGSTHDVDKDTSMLCLTNLLECGGGFLKDVSDPYYGIGDNEDHNGFNRIVHTQKSSIYRVNHCITFRELYDLQGIPMKHMGRIGMVCADIRVLHQNSATVNGPVEQ